MTDLPQRQKLVPSDMCIKSTKSKHCSTRSQKILEASISASVEEDIIYCYNLIEDLTMEARDYFQKVVYVLSFFILKIRFGVVAKKMQ